MKEIAIGSDGNSDCCTACGGSIIPTRSGCTCVRCGLIYDERYADDGFCVDKSDIYEQKSAKQFVGLGKQLDNVSPLGSYIDFYKTATFHDGKGKPLPSERQRFFARLKFMRDFVCKIKTKETYYRIVKIMKDVSERLRFTPDLRKRAVFLYNKVLQVAASNQLKVPNHVSLITTCMFLASREYASRAPVTIRELCRAFTDLGHRINYRMIYRDVMQFKKDLGLRRVKRDGKDYIERLASDLYHDRAFNARFGRKARLVDAKSYVQQLKVLSATVIESIPRRVRDGRNPFVLAGAAIYGADAILSRRTGQKRVLTQQILADATGIAEYSIRDHYCVVIKPVLSLGKDEPPAIDLQCPVSADVGTTLPPDLQSS